MAWIIITIIGTISKKYICKVKWKGNEISRLDAGENCQLQCWKKCISNSLFIYSSNRYLGCKSYMHWPWFRYKDEYKKQNEAQKPDQYKVNWDYLSSYPHWPTSLCNYDNWLASRWTCKFIWQVFRIEEGDREINDMIISSICVGIKGILTFKLRYTWRTIPLLLSNKERK